MGRRALFSEGQEGAAGVSARWDRLGRFGTLDAMKRREKLRQLGGRAKNLEMEPDAIVRIQSFTARPEEATVLASVFLARNRER